MVQMVQQVDGAAGGWPSCDEVLQARIRSTHLCVRHGVPLLLQVRVPERAPHQAEGVGHQAQAGLVHCRWGRRKGHRSKLKVWGTRRRSALCTAGWQGPVGRSVACAAAHPAGILLGLLVAEQGIQWVLDFVSSSSGSSKRWGSNAGTSR